MKVVFLTGYVGEVSEAVAKRLFAKRAAKPYAEAPKAPEAPETPKAHEAPKAPGRTAPQPAPAVAPKAV